MEDLLFGRFVGLHIEVHILEAALDEGHCVRTVRVGIDAHVRDRGGRFEEELLELGVALFFGDLKLAFVENLNGSFRRKEGEREGGVRFCRFHPRFRCRRRR